MTGEKESARILIVDDIEYNRDILDKILSSAGYQTNKVGSGEEALEYIKSNTPDLVLLDIRMPKLSGYDVCQELMKDARFGEIPIIFITSEYKDEQNMKMGLEMGGLYYLTRPIDRSELLARIRVGLRIRDAFKEILTRVEKLEDSYDDFLKRANLTEEKFKELQTKLESIKKQA